MDRIFNCLNMENFKKRDLPIHHTVKLSKIQCPSNDKEIQVKSRVPYPFPIGSIMYVMNCTGPDVSYSLNMVSQYQSNPGGVHLIEIKNILMYL